MRLRKRLKSKSEMSTVTDWYSKNNIEISESVGVDEVGRGPLAGPVVAAAVWLNIEGAEYIRRSGLVVRDSKKMTESARNNVVELLSNMPSTCLKKFIASASVDEIDSLNILRATMLAMRRAYEGLQIDCEYLLVDGNRGPDVSAQIITVVKGDDKVLSISLASIIAKQYRDGLMRELAKEYPIYGWDSNVGYGTKKHLQAIADAGITPHHRMSFAPIKAARNK